MILVVCPNLAIDVTLEIETLSPGTVHRAERASRRAGGKGVNLARALLGLGAQPRLLGLAGGKELPRRIQEESLDAELVPIGAESRTCTILLERNGSATVVNERGPRVTDSTELLERYDALLPDARAVALMGSLQPGLPVDLYASMVRRARSNGLFALVDTSGAALVSAMDALPSIVTPNRDEAEALVRRPLRSEEECVAAAREIRGRGPNWVYITRGENGAVSAGPDGFAASARLATPADLRLGNPTGTGDAFAAGLVFAQLRGYGASETLGFAVAAATASLAEGYGRIRARDVRPEVVSMTIY